MVTEIHVVLRQYMHNISLFFMAHKTDEKSWCEEIVCRLNSDQQRKVFTMSITSGSIILAIVAVLSAVVGKSEATENASASVPSAGGIIGGKWADSKTASHLVYIEFDIYAKRGIDRGTCTGTVIGDRKVLTAAHCFVGRGGRFRIRATMVWVNKLSLSKSREFYSDGYEVDFVDVHYQYNHKTFANDIAILTTTKPFPGSVRRVQLARSGTDGMTSDTILYAAGYGLLKNGGRPARRLHEVQLSYRPFLECMRKENRKDRKGLKSSLFICASAPDMEKGGMDTCSGDSGGPLFANEQGGSVLRQYGITSYSTWKCGEKGGFAWYTNVAYFAGAIERHLDGDWRSDWDDVSG